MTVTVQSAYPRSGIHLYSIGKPPTQGSVRPMVTRGTGRVYLQQSAGQRLAEFRREVRDAIRDLEGWEPIDAPARLVVVAYLPRPRGHYRTGRFSHLLRGDAPVLPTSKPDGDKVLRAVNDALTQAGVWRDDALAYDQRVTKLWADDADRPVGVEIRVVVK